MKLFIPLKLAFKNLQSNKARTAFSVLGIVIGTASVIAVMSLGAGLKNFVVGQVEIFGTDIVELKIKTPKTKQISAANVSSMAGGAQITTLTLDDIEAVSKLSNIGSWYGGILGQEVANVGEKNKQVFIFGVTADIIKVDKNFKLRSGMMFSGEDDKNLSRVVVLGSKLKETFFPEGEAVGKFVKIKGQRYRIIGVAEERGVSGFFDFDNVVYIPVQTLQKKIMGIKHIQFAIYKIIDMRKADLTLMEITDLMRERHNIKDSAEDDFAVVSILETKAILDKIFSIINFLLLGLVSISLLVSGVGIMNVMYVAVSERTKEIGLRKSIGADNADILRQFTVESIILALIGGAGGILIGYIFSNAVSYVANQAGFSVQLKVDWQTIAIAFSFSALTGVFFGFYPARKASRMAPTESLRKE